MELQSKMSPEAPQVSPEAIKSNIAYYNALYVRLTSEATDAWSQVQKWTAMLYYKNQGNTPKEDSSVTR